MGKVFNDQIIKILCTKNINKIQNDIAEPLLKQQKCSCLRRGESYIVFLDREHRRQLQRAIDLPMNANKSSEQAICKLGIDPTLKNKGTTSTAIESWLSKAVSRRRSYIERCNTLSRLCDHFKGIGKFLDYMKRRCEASKESARSTPAVHGPFPDEFLCAAIDRFFYCLFLLAGHELQPLEEQTH